MTPSPFCARICWYSLFVPVSFAMRYRVLSTTHDPWNSSRASSYGSGHDVFWISGFLCSHEVLGGGVGIA